MKRQDKSVTALTTTTTKALAVIAVLLTTACNTVSILGGSLDSHAQASISDEKPTVQLGIQLRLDLGKANSKRNPDVDASSATDDLSVVAPLLDLIGRAEGTDKGDGYNETLAYGAYSGGDVALVTMTLSQIDNLQTAMLRHPENHWNSSAIGRYQITRTTLRTLKQSLGLEDEMMFSVDLQDRLALELLKRRGLTAWKAGTISDQQFATNLAKEWASLPVPDTGTGHYPGQRAAVGYAAVKAVLELVRKF